MADPARGPACPAVRFGFVPGVPPDRLPFTHPTSNPMKSAILVHGLWVAVAAGAFYTGSRWHATRTESADGARRTVGFAADAGLTPAEQAAVLKTGALSRDASVADFFSRYELGSGNPLTAEKMR